MRALLEDRRIEPVRTRTRVACTIYLDPVRAFRPLLGLMKRLLGRQLDKGMRAFAARAEGR